MTTLLRPSQPDLLRHLADDRKGWKRDVACSSRGRDADCGMADDQVRITARIHFLTTEEGGRETPLKGGGSYRPNHNFGGPDNREMCMGFIDLPEGREVRPGDTIEVPLSLLIWPELKQAVALILQPP